MKTEHASKLFIHVCLLLTISVRKFLIWDDHLKHKCTVKSTLVYKASHEVGVNLQK